MGRKGGDDTLARYWGERRSRVNDIRSAGQIVITKERGRLQVICPPSQDFDDEARDCLNGRWRYRTRRWTFAASQIEEVRDALSRHYTGVEIRELERQP